MENEDKNLAATMGAPNMQHATSLSNEKLEPLADGQVPQNSQGVTSGQYDALNGAGVEKVQFQQGNYNQVVGYPQLITDKVQSLTQTFVPLIEVALIELLGNNQMYQRQSGQVALSFDNNQIALSFSFIYIVTNFVGTDIDTSSISHDANYILNRLRPTGANITKCEIDTTEGTVTIQGSV